MRLFILLLALLIAVALWVASLPPVPVSSVTPPTPVTLPKLPDVGHPATSK